MIYETDDEHVDIKGRRDVTDVVCPNATVLDCSHTSITSLDNLPSGLWYLCCSNTRITSLDHLPSGVEYLSCSNTRITSLDHLPSGLKTLSCRHTDITSLDNLPSGLKTLSCRHTDITSLDNLPSGLRNLYCRHTGIKSLDNLQLIVDCKVYGFLPWRVCLRNGVLKIGCEEHTPAYWQANLDEIAAEHEHEVTSEQLRRVREFVDGVVKFTQTKGTK